MSTVDETVCEGLQIREQNRYSHHPEGISTESGRQTQNRNRETHGKAGTELGSGLQGLRAEWWSNT